MAEEKQSDDAGAKKSGNSNTLLIVIIAVLATLLVAGGIGGVLMMRGGGSHESTDASSDESKKDTAAESKSEDKKGKKDGAKGPAIYVSLEPPFVVNFEAGQAARFLQISVQLMTRDSATSQLLKDNEPLVRNDLLLLFANQTYETVSTAAGKEELRKHALDAVRAIVKQEGGKSDLLEAVYFTSFVMQ